MSERFDLPHNRSIVGAKPLGHKDYLIGYYGRGKNPRVRRPVIFSTNPPNPNYPIQMRGMMRPKPGTSRTLFISEVWNPDGPVYNRGEILQDDEQRALELLIVLAKELL